MKIKRRYLDDKYVHDIDKWEEDTKNRINTASTMASSGIGAFSGAVLGRNIKSRPGRAAAILVPASVMGTGGYILANKSGGDYIKKVADWRRDHYKNSPAKDKQEMRSVKRWLEHEDKADKRMKSLEKKFSEDNHERVYKDDGKKYLVAPSVLGAGGVALGVGLDKKIEKGIKNKVLDDAVLKRSGLKPNTVGQRIKNKVRESVGEELKNTKLFKTTGEKMVENAKKQKEPVREAWRKLVGDIANTAPSNVKTKEELKEYIKNKMMNYKTNTLNKNKGLIAKKIRRSKVIAPLALGTAGALVGSSVINRGIRGTKELEDEYYNDI